MTDNPNLASDHESEESALRAKVINHGHEKMQQAETYTSEPASLTVGAKVEEWARRETGSDTGLAYVKLVDDDGVPHELYGRLARALAGAEVCDRYTITITPTGATDDE